MGDRTRLRKWRWRFWRQRVNSRVGALLLGQRGKAHFGDGKGRAIEPFACSLRKKQQGDNGTEAFADISRDIPDTWKNA
ncbi:hypothetical protein AA0472_1297 [Acetobacter estunensis NRIC 0472]|nr:hypothetical protein AA0472_1297 [Acetobacter estunensis NRIC 0472]